MFEFCVWYPIPQAVRNLNVATFCTSPSLKYLISGQHHHAFVIANADEIEEDEANIYDFVPQCQIVIHRPVPKDIASCKCENQVEQTLAVSSAVEGTIGKMYPLESWTQIGPQSWIYPLRFCLPQVAAPCTVCYSECAVYNSCSVTVQVLHKAEHSSNDTNWDDISLPECVYTDDKLFSVVHLPVLVTSLITGDKNKILLKVQNVAYNAQIIESLDIFAHSNEGETNPPLTSEDVVSTTCDITPSSQTGVFPLRLLMFEAQTLMFNVDLKDIKPGTSQEYNIIAQLSWKPEGHSEIMDKTSITWPLLSCLNLSKIEVRYPAFVITAAPNCKQPLNPNTKFSMQYTVDNKLQDLTSLKLIWSPEKAILEKKALEDPVYRESINNILNSVVCHQPVLEMGCCVQGTSTRVYVDFTILTPGLYELGQHMKLNIQPSLWSSPSKGSLHASTPAGSPNPTHQQRQGIQNSTSSHQLWNTSPKKPPQQNVLSNLWSKDTGQPPVRQNPVRSDTDAIMSVKVSGIPKALPQQSANLKSPPTPGGAVIHPTEVLKHNCQVLVLDSSTTK